MIPVYPEFASLSLAELGAFKEAFNIAQPRISEFTFTNLYSWRNAYNFQVTRKDGFLILASDYKGQRRFLYPIGNGDIKKIVAELLESPGVSLIRVPEEIKALFDNSELFNVEQDRDNSDYLYEAADLLNLSGRKFDGKRNLISNFKAKYKYDYLRLNPDNVQECLDFEEFWCTIKDCDNQEGLSNERIAIREMVDNFAVFDLVGGAIRVDSKISAVAIGQELNRDTLVMHVLKADPKMSGLYQLIMHGFLSKEAAGFKYVNMEQDLGVEGLRKAKLSYHPAAMVNKYTIKK